MATIAKPGRGGRRIAVLLFTAGAALLATLAQPAFAAGLAGIAEPRTFTDSEGRTLVATITALDERMVTVRRTDGTAFTIPFERLSTLDQRFLTENRAAIIEAVTPLPDTAFLKLLRENFTLLNPSGSALMDVPPETWSRARRFAIVYDLGWDVELIRKVPLEAKPALPDDTVILRIGPHGTDRYPPPSGSDLAVARTLPAGAAVIRRASLMRDLETARSAYDKIVSREAAGNGGVFHSLLGRSSPETTQGWRDEVRATLPAYWPGPAFMDPDLGAKKPPRVFLCDREGRPFEDQPKRTALGGAVAPFPATPNIDPPISASAPTTAAPSTTLVPIAPHAFTLHDTRGQPFEALLVSLEADRMTIARASDDRLFTVGLDKVHALDRETVAQLRSHANLRSKRPSLPLPPREVTDNEVLAAKRFVRDVAFSSQSGAPQTIRWQSRPLLVVHAQNKSAETTAAGVFDDFLAATGMDDQPAPNATLIVCTGDLTFLNECRQKLDPHTAPLRSSSYRFWYGRRGTLEKMIVYVHTQAEDPDRTRFETINQMARAFGIRGESDVFKDTAFEPGGARGDLSPLDRHFLRFYYRHVPDRTSREELFKIVETHWRDPDATPAGR